MTLSTLTHMNNPAATPNPHAPPIEVVPNPNGHGYLIAYTTDTRAIQHLYPPAGTTIPTETGDSWWETAVDAQEALGRIYDESVGAPIVDLTGEPDKTNSVEQPNPTG